MLNHILIKKNKNTCPKNNKGAVVEGDVSGILLSAFDIP